MVKLYSIAFVLVLIHQIKHILIKIKSTKILTKIKSCIDKYNFLLLIPTWQKKLNRPKAKTKIVTPSLTRLHLFSFSTIPSTPGMSSSIRPMRRAAQLAAARINQIAQNDASSTDSDTSTSSVNHQIDEGMLRAAKYGYDSTIHIIRFLINEMDNAKFEDQRCEIAEKIFDTLDKNPTILIYEPNFRNAVVNKLNEVQELIKKRSDTFEIGKQQYIIRLMSVSVRTNIRNSAMRQKIYKHLIKINNILKDYKDWTYGKNLNSKISNLNNTLNSIKNNPNYIPAPVLN